MSASCARSVALDNGVRAVIEAGMKFDLPVGIDGTADFKNRFAQGARVFVASETASMAGKPISDEELKAAGR